MSILVDELVNVCRPGNTGFRRVGDTQYVAKPCDFYGFSTITSRTFKAFTFIVAVLIGLFILTHKMTLQIGIALIGGIGLYLWLSFYIVWYFMLCETYWENDNE